MIKDLGYKIKRTRRCSICIYEKNVLSIEHDKMQGNSIYSVNATEGGVRK